MHNSRVKFAGNSACQKNPGLAGYCSSGFETSKLRLRPPPGTSNFIQWPHGERDTGNSDETTRTTRAVRSLVRSRHRRGADIPLDFRRSGRAHRSRAAAHLQGPVVGRGWAHGRTRRVRVLAWRAQRRPVPALPGNRGGARSAREYTPRRLACPASLHSWSRNRGACHVARSSRGAQ